MEDNCAHNHMRKPGRPAEQSLNNLAGHNEEDLLLANTVVHLTAHFR